MSDEELASIRTESEYSRRMISLLEPIILILGEIIALEKSFDPADKAMIPTYQSMLDPFMEKLMKLSMHRILRMYEPGCWFIGSSRTWHESSMRHSFSPFSKPFGGSCTSGWTVYVTSDVLEGIKPFKKPSYHHHLRGDPYSKRRDFSKRSPLCHQVGQKNKIWEP